MKRYIERRSAEAEKINTVIGIYEATREGNATVNATVDALVEALGRSEAVAAVATVVNAVSLHDGRISDKNREWAQSVENAPTNAELRAAGIYGVDSWMHSAHVDNLAAAMRRYLRENPEEEKKAKTLEEIIEDEQKHRHEDGMFGIAACKDSIRTAVELFGDPLEQLLSEYVEKANTDAFFNKAMVLACYELLQEEAEQAKEEPKEGEEMTYNEVMGAMQDGMIPVSALYDEAQHTEPEQITAEAVEDFRQEHGEAAAADLLTLIGADRFSGDYSCALETLQGIVTRQKVAQEQREKREREQAETDEENRRHCRHIADEVEAWAEGNIYKCPHCGECYDIEDAEETEAGHICPECGEEIEENEAEQQSLYDYFADVLDIEYRTDSAGDYRSVRLMVAFGGPNIYIDTASASVELYWWGDRASAYFSRSAADEIDAAFSEIFDMR